MQGMPERVTRILDQRNIIALLGGLHIVVMFSKSRDFTPYCLSPPRHVDWYSPHTAGGNTAMDKHPITGGGGGGVVILPGYVT